MQHIKEISVPKEISTPSTVKFWTHINDGVRFDCKYHRFLEGHLHLFRSLTYYRRCYFFGVTQTSKASCSLMNPDNNNC